MNTSITAWSRPVEPPWIDKNGQVDSMRYQTIADRGARALFALAGITETCREAAQVTFSGPKCTSALNANCGYATQSKCEAG